MVNCIDIKENKIIEIDPSILKILLKDNSSNDNIIWATDDYSFLGDGYAFNNHITIDLITGKNGNIIRPRVEKTKEQQTLRSRNKAEVFTPSWVCNIQNNLIDNAWFGRSNIFNIEDGEKWRIIDSPIVFPNEKKWQDYVKEQRLEITCGEAPYLVSRYDTVTGKYIPVIERIGLLDRKMRVVAENTDNENDWYLWANKAFKSVFGFDWQGDNVLLARENLLYSFIDYYENKFKKDPSKKYLIEIATILSWNIWQMDGLKFVIPKSCHVENIIEHTLFGEISHEQECEGCKNNVVTKHNGIYSYIMDWDTGKSIKFVEVANKNV